MRGRENDRYKKGCNFIISTENQGAPQMVHPLEEAGFQVIIISQKDCIDDLIALVDPCMVFIDDSNLTCQIRAQKKYTRIPIVLTSQTISPAERILSLESDVDFCMDGIVTPQELVARVHVLLRRV